MIGTSIGSYQILAELGKGGMGAVYLAEHKLIGRKAAIKTLLPHFCHRPEIVRRFFNEAKAATAVKHPGIVEIYDMDVQDDGAAFIAMEYLEGETLKAHLRRHKGLPVEKAIELVRQTASALAAAHSKGVIHRDLKPDNIFIVPDPEIGERVKILDFGIAKLIEGDDAGEHRTNTGTVMGTPSYMSPEQCRGAGKVDLRADLYSLGCIFFELVCGQPPFIRDGSGAVMGAHMYEQPPPPRTLAPSLSPALDAFILRLLAKNPDERFATATDLLHALPGARLPTNDGGMVMSGMVTNRPATPLPSVAQVEQTTLSNASAAVGLGPTHAAHVAPAAATGISRRWMIIAAPVLLSIGVGSVAVFIGGFDEREAETVTVVASENGKHNTPTEADQQANSEEPETAAPDEPSVPEAESIDSATEIAEQALITIVIKSSPPGAKVFVKGATERLGKTPLEHQVKPSNEDLAFVLKKRGYKQQEIVFPGNEDGSKEVMLKETTRKKKPSQQQDSLQDTSKKDKEIKEGAAVNPF